MLKRKILLFLFCIITLQLSGQNTLVKSTDDNLFRTGLELINHSKYGAARETFQRYVSLEKGNLQSIEAEYYIALCAMHLFNSDAEVLFENFIDKHPYHSKAVLAYLELGNFNFNNKKYDKAIEYYEKVDLQRLSEDQKLDRNFRLGYSYFSQKEFEKAEPFFNEVKRSENKYTYAGSYYAGYIESKNGNYEAALVDLKKAEQNESYKPLVPVMIANIYYRQGAYDELIAYSEKTLSSNDKTLQGKDDIFLFTADAYYSKKDYAKSAEYFRKFKSENKSRTSPEITYRLAYSEYKVKNYDGAIANFKEIAGAQDSLAQSAAYYLGVSYIQKGNKQFALTAFDQASKASFSSETKEEALFNYGKVNFDLLRYHDAIAAFKSFSKEYPKSKHNAEVQELLSESFLRTSNYSEALSYIESLKVRSLRINTAYQRVSFHSGVQLYNNGKLTEAIQLFEKSSEFPLDKDIYLAANFWKGESFSASKDYTNAIKSYSVVFQNADDNNEYHIKSRYGIGYAYFNTKQYDKALPHFKAYVDKLKNAKDKQFYDDALLRLADLNYQSKRYEEAIRYYNEAVAGKISDLDYAYYQRGVVYGILDKMLDANTNLDMVIKYYPASVYHDDAIFEKAQLNSQQGNNEESIAGFSKLIKEKQGSPYIPYALLKRAIAYTNINKTDESIRDYETILTNYSTHEVASEAFKGLQMAYATAGRTEEFQKWIGVMEKIDPKNSLLVTARFDDAKNLYFAKKYQPAVNAFLNYISSYPESANIVESKFYLADSYAGINDMDNSIKYYKEVVESKAPLYYVRAIIRIADIEFKRSKFEEAKTYYGLLSVNARNKKDKLTALNGLMESNFITKNYDSTIYYANEIKASGNAAIDAESKALLYTGKSYYAQQNFDKATDFFLSTINLAKDRNAAEAQYLIAEIQYNQKKHRQSLETLYQLNNIFSEYDDWIGKTFLLVADNFIALNETFQAKATLKSIIENSTHKESVEKAKIKLTELEGKEKGTNE